MTPLLPETAPFNPEQRAWLNGFFAGVFAIDAQGMTSSNTVNISQTGRFSAEVASGIVEQSVNSTIAEESFPWHDPNMELEERLKLAEGRPLERRLMAAMAQLNCGQCGYLCQTYAEALADGKETNQGLCVPGGKETKKKIKELFQIEVSSKPLIKQTNEVAIPAVESHRAATAEHPHYSRNQPYAAELLEVRCLNAPGSFKETNLIRLAFKDPDISYETGDSLGVWAENCLEHVQQIIHLLGATPSTMVTLGVRAAHLEDVLLKQLDLRKPTEKFMQLLMTEAANLNEAKTLQEMLDQDNYDEYEVQDLLEMFPSAKPSVQAFVETLSPMQPRLYSISSSPKAHAGEVHLTVAAVRYELKGKSRKGVASTFLADRVPVGQSVKVFAHTSPHFRLPSDLSKPVIMVGPGTGIAPFRAFLHERAATKASGKNWLFFGDQRKSMDFLFQQELEDLQKQGVLTRLDTAFSRDADQKCYVQHRMLEKGLTLWEWLEDGAYFYVCGDAKRMAKDVHETLLNIVQTHAGMSIEDSKSYLQKLNSQGRYCRDVY